MANQQATMRDVARLAGTSKATVSNVMAGHPHVRPETRDRVLAAAKALGYHVNIAARSLAQKRTKVLGVIVGDLENPWYVGVVAHIERQARARGHAVLMVSTWGDPTTEPASIRTLIEHRVAAILVLSASTDDLMRAVPPDIPIVSVGLRGAGGPTVSVDDRLGAQLAVSHLMGLGHRRVGYVGINPGREPATFAERFAGYRQALAATPGALEASEGLAVRVVGPFLAHETTDLSAAIDALLLQDPRPTAIFGADDLAALEVLERADALGLRISEDLSIVGFDDINMARLPRIALTTVGHPVAAMAERSVEAALAQADGDGANVPSLVLLEPQLIVRGTTGPAPA